jgi:thioredoxin-disulfide reductase
MEDIYDVIIIGGASAGLTAAIYSSRRAMKTLVLTKDIGGQLSTTPDVENYPGYEFIEGWTLSDKFKKQAEKFGAEVVFAEVSSVNKEGEDFVIMAAEKKYVARTVILAFGKTPRNLDVPGEYEYRGKGVSYCATCDMPLFKKKTVAVVGGGNSALDAAIYGSNVAEKVYLIHRRDQYRGEQVLIDRMNAIANIEPIYNAIVKKVKGEQFVTAITIEDVNTGEERDVIVNGVFVEIGYVVKAEFVKHLVEMNERSEVITDKHMMTVTPGLFAAGDLTTSIYKQAVISAGEGCTAALAAYEYLLKKQGRTAVTADWGIAPKEDPTKVGATLTS